MHDRMTAGMLSTMVQQGPVHVAVLRYGAALMHPSLLTWSGRTRLRSTVGHMKCRNAQCTRSTSVKSVLSRRHTQRVVTAASTAVPQGTKGTQYIAHWHTTQLAACLHYNRSPTCHNIVNIVGLEVAKKPVNNPVKTAPLRA